MISGRIQTWVMLKPLSTAELILGGMTNDNREQMARGKMQQAEHLLVSEDEVGLRTLCGNIGDLSQNRFLELLQCKLPLSS